MNKVASYKERKKLENELKAIAEQNRLIKHDFPTYNQRETKRMLENEIPNCKVRHIEPDKDGKMATFYIEVADQMQLESFTAGSAISRISAIAIGEEKYNKAAIEEQSELFVMTFPRSIADQMDASYKEELGIKKKVVSMDGNTVQLHFEFGDCKSRLGIAARVSLILDSMIAIRDKAGMKRDLEYLQLVKSELAKALPLETKFAFFKRVKGSILIGKGIANCIDSRSKLASKFQRLLNWFRGTKKGEYLYYGNVVNPESDYVVEVVEEFEQPKIENFAEQVDLRYEFGEMVYKGFGLELVEAYYRQIAQIDRKNKNAAKE